MSPGQVAEQQSSPWDHRLRLDVPLPGVCFINCICSALFFFFFFLLYCRPLQADQKHKVLRRGPCGVALKSLPPVPVTLPSLSVGLLVGLPGESGELGRTANVSGKHARNQAAMEKRRRWRERAGKCEPGAEREKSQGYPPPPPESPGRAGRATPRWRCAIPFLSGTGQDPDPSRAVTGVSGGAFRAAALPFCQGLQQFSTRLCVQTSRYPASQSGLI